MAAGAGLATSLGPRDLARFGRFLMLPARRMGQEEFGGEAARRLLSGCALHADLTPESTLSGFFGWLMCCLDQANGFPVPEGGARSVTAALVARLTSKGGTVHCGAPVDRVETELVLEVRSRPLGRARVTFRLRARDDGSTEVDFDEEPIGFARLLSPVAGPLALARNHRSLDHLDDYLRRGAS